MFRLKLVIFSLVFLACGAVLANEEEDFYVAQKAFSEGFYDASQGLFEKFINNYSKSSRKDEARLFIAKSFFHRQAFKQAEEALSGLLDEADLSQTKSEALHWLGEINFQAKKYAKAVEFFKAAREEDETSSIFWWSAYSLGFSYLELGQKDKAKDVLNDIIASSSQDEVKQNAFFALSEIHYKDKQFKELEELALAWLKAFPGASRQDYVYFYLGESSYSFKEFKPAVEHYSQALKSTSDEHLKDLIYQGLGWSWLEQEDFKQAGDWFQKISSEEVKLYSLGSLYFKLRNFKDANIYFDKFIKTYPQSLFLYKAYLGQAESLYSLGRINDAFLYYSKIIENKDRIDDSQIVEEAYYSLGWCYLKMNDYKKAIDQFRKLALSGEPIIKISAQINIGDVYQESGDLKEALEVYEQVIEEFPNNLYSDYIQLQIGLCFLKQDDFEGCLLALDSLLKNFSRSKLVPEALYYTALCHASLGNMDEAARILEQAASQLTDSSILKKIYLLMIQVYMDKSDPETVLKIYGKASKDFSDDRQFLERLIIQKGLLYVDQEKGDMAKKTFKEFLKSFPDSEFNDRILLYLANIYHKEQDYKNAMLYYTQIVEDDSFSRYSYQARLNLAQILWEEGRFDEAETLLKANLESNSQEVVIQTKLMLTEFMISKEEFAKALDIYDGLIEDYPDSKGFFYFKKAKIYEEKGDFKLAYKNYKTAQGSQFDSAALRFSKGYVLERMGNPSEAIKNFFDGIFIFPDDQKNAVKSYLRIAKLYEKLGSLSEARKAYQKIIDMGVGEAKYAQEKLKELDKR